MRGLFRFLCHEDGITSPQVLMDVIYLCVAFVRLHD